MTVYQRDGTQTHPLPDQTPGKQRWLHPHILPQLPRENREPN